MPRVGSAQEGLDIPEVPWAEVQARVGNLWVVRDAPHMSVIGQTRSGKSYLVRHGILPLCKYDRVLFIDAKGDDRTITGLGQVVDHFPTKAERNVRQSGRKWMHDDPVPMAQWYRLVTSEKTETAAKQVGHALESIRKEGDWIVVSDELRYLTDTREPGIGMLGEWSAIIMRGGSRGIGMISLTQEPRWVPGLFYTQPSFFWISRVEDEAAQKRIAEIGSSRALISHLNTIRRRYWIYTDSLEDDRYWGMTTVVKSAESGADATVESGQSPAIHQYPSGTYGAARIGDPGKSPTGRQPNESFWTHAGFTGRGTK